MFDLPHYEELLDLLPGALSATVLVIFSAMLVRRGPVKTAVLLAGAAFAVAHLISWLVINAEVPIRKVTSSERAAHGVCAFAAVAIVSGWLRAWHGLVRVLHYSVTALVLYYVLHPMIERSSAAAGHVSALRLLGYVGAALFLWVALETFTERVKSAALPLTLALVTGASGQLFFLYGSGFLAQLMGTAALALLLITLGVRLMPDSQLPRPVAGGVAGLITCLFADAYHFMSRTPPAPALGLLAATPLLLTLSLIPSIDRMSPRRRFAFQMSIVIAVVAVAFWIGVAHMPADDGGGEYDPGFEPGK